MNGEDERLINAVLTNTRVSTSSIIGVTKVTANSTSSPENKGPKQFDFVTPDFDYSWPRGYGISKPFSHQVETTKFLVRHQRAFCLNDMGTGKTISVLWAFDYLRRAGTVKSMLVVCPLSTMLRTWGDELNANFRGILRYKILHGGDASYRLRALSERADVYIVNPAGSDVLHPRQFSAADLALCQ